MTGWPVSKPVVDINDQLIEEVSLRLKCKQGSAQSCPSSSRWLQALGEDSLLLFSRMIGLS